MKTYEYGGKTVIAVPEKNICDGCCFFNVPDSLKACEMGDSFNTATENQAKNGMPDCIDNKIIFKETKNEKDETT